MKLIVGLGNPGKEYALTRHNIGFRCLNRLARAHRLAFSLRQCQAHLAQGEIARVPVLLAKPFTFVNRSGVAVAGLLRRFTIPPADLLVIYDDMDLPLGKLRLRPRGSAGGHHGMESILQEVGSQDFPRLRVGIGDPEGEAIDFVLGTFSPGAEAVAEEAIARAVAAVECYLAQGLEAAMNRFNSATPPPGEPPISPQES